MKTTLTMLCVALAALEPLFAADPTADELAAREPPKYIVEAAGKRLNSFISRDISILARAYSKSRDAKYLDATVKYMKAAADYPDWRAIQHYLSASYIVDAFAEAFELCGDDMKPDVRMELEDALVEKGLKPASLHWFWYANGNWTQVCCAAVAHAALALRKRFPEKCDKCTRRCVAATKQALAAYAPDGCYAEGPSYWKFATEKTERMIETLKRYLGNDCGISAMPGYRESFEWVKAMKGPTGRLFNYGDGDGAPEVGEWAVGKTTRKVFRGVQPTAVVAGSNFYLAVKGGKASLNHAHMDAGSFVFETCSNGKAVRWVEDLGTERYRHIERAKVDIWNFTQSSTRWGVFRHGPFSHSTFTIDSAPHRVDGAVALNADAEPNAIVADMSALYSGIWQGAVRKWSVDEDGELRLKDSFTGVGKGHVYTFNFCTFAKAEVKGAEVCLAKDGEVLVVTALAKGTWSVEDVSKPRKPYESPNRGAKRIAFTCDLPEGDVEFRMKNWRAPAQSRD